MRIPHIIPLFTHCSNNERRKLDWKRQTSSLVGWASALNTVGYSFSRQTKRVRYSLTIFEGSKWDDLFVSQVYHSVSFKESMKNTQLLLKIKVTISTQLIENLLKHQNLGQLSFSLTTYFLSINCYSL